MTEHKGSCLCGDVQFKISGSFAGFYLCHCRYCQKDTGTAHAANVFTQGAQLSWLTGADEVTVFARPGSRHQKSFCRLCGSALPSQQSKDAWMIPAGSLDTALNIPPTAHIFTASKPTWDKNLEHIPQFDKLPE